MLSAQMQKKYKIDWKYNQLIAFVPNCLHFWSNFSLFITFYTLCNSSHHFAHFENKKKCRTFKTFNFSLAVLGVQMVLLSVIYNHFFSKYFLISWCARSFFTKKILSRFSNILACSCSRKSYAITRVTIYFFLQYIS